MHHGITIVTKAVKTPLLILEKCVGFPQQPWRGTSILETELAYMSTITIDIIDWKIWSVGGLIIILSLKSTRTSANFDYQSSLPIRNQILDNIPAVMKYTINVTRIQKHQYSKSMNTFSHQLNPCSRLLKGTGLAKSSLPIYLTAARYYWHQLL